MTATITDCTVYLNAAFDLYHGHGGDEDAFAEARDIEVDSDELTEAFADDFSSAYRIAAKELGEELGITIRVEDCPMSGYEGLPGGHCESEEWAQECDLWQLLHDLVAWDSETSEWLPNTKLIEDTARKIQDQFAD
jgi:hypothetical protein